MELLPLPKCAVLTCENTADPRFYAIDVNGHAVMICDGHEPVPAPSEVAVRPPDPSARDLAERIVHAGYAGYAATPSEVRRVAAALIASEDAARELAELRDLADIVRDADILTLPPELLAVRQRWIAEESAREEAALAEQWEVAPHGEIVIVRCRRCGFETFPFADAAIEAHMAACA